MTEALVLPGHEGTITVAASALERVVVRAAESVEGARVRKPKRTVEVTHEPGRASVSFELAVERGGRVPDLAPVVQERVAEALAATTGLEVERVDVIVAEIG